MRFLLVALVAGCATTPPRPPLGYRQGEWHEVSSAHFVLRTDLPSQQAEEVSDELELTYQLLEQIFRSDLPEATPSPPPHMSVVLFRDHRDMEALFPARGGRGFFRSNDELWEREPMIILPADERSRWLAGVRHELTHGFVAHYLPTSPAWLNEGLATLYSTLRVRDGEVVIGEWNDHQFLSGIQPNVREILSAREDNFHTGAGHYTEAHTLVHLLESERRGHRSQFLDFLRQLARGVRGDLAWRSSFGEPDLDRFEGELNRYRFLQRTDTRRMRVAVRSDPRRLRTLSEADLHLLWLELQPWRREKRQAIENELAIASRLDPQSPAVKLWQARVAHAVRAADETSRIRAALDADPNNPHLLYLATEADPVWWPPLREAAITSDQLIAVAAERLRAHDMEAALGFARRAAATGPANARNWWYLAALLHRAGQHEEAVIAAARAAWLLPSSGSYLSDLRDYLRAAQAGAVKLKHPYDQLPPPPPAPRWGGVELRGRIVDGQGRAIDRSWVHVTSRFEVDMVRTDAQGRFVAHAPAGAVFIWVLPDEGERLADSWQIQVRPGTRPVDVGSFSVETGRIPDPLVAIDGIDPVNRDGVAMVNSVDPKSAAGLAGVQARDRLLEINGHDVTHAGSNAMNYLLSGKVDDEITIVLERAGKQLTVQFRLRPIAPQ